MNTAKDILKFNEGILQPKKVNNSIDIIRNIVIGIVFIIIVASILFGENIFLELNWVIQIFLVALVIRFIILTDGKVDVPSPVEIIFYDDYFVVHRPKVWRGKNRLRQESDIMNYDQVTRIKYISESRRFHIYGTYTGKYYKYTKQGGLEATPYYDKVVQDGMLFFSTRCTEEDDNLIMDVLSKYIPDKLEIK